jgi:hypothetical protein
MDLVIDERDSNVSSSKSGDDDDQDDDQSSPQPPSGFPPQPPTSSSRSSSYNQHSPDGSTTPFNHQTKSVNLRFLFNIMNYLNTCFIFSFVHHHN